MLTLQLIAFLAYLPMQESLLLGHWPFKYFLILLVKQRLYVEQMKHIARLQMFLLTMSSLLFPSFSAIRQQILPCVEPGNHSYQRFFSGSAWKVKACLKTSLFRPPARKSPLSRGVTGKRRNMQMIPKLQPSQKSFLQILGGKEALSKRQHLPIQEKAVLSIPERICMYSTWLQNVDKDWNNGHQRTRIRKVRLNSSKIQKQRNSCHLISPSAWRTRKNLKTPHTSFLLKI